MDPVYLEKLNRAIHLRDNKDESGAIRILNDLYRDFPDHTLPLPLIGGIYLKNAQYNEASYYFNMHTKLKPSNWISSQGLYSALLNLSEVEGALNEGLRMLKLFDSGVEISPLRNQGDHSDLKEYLDEIICLASEKD